ncbi:MAG: SH3 domain-containing protein [Candidatus Theseobacter exili]|nr:SH3 domain-containing protein [Candidatus Theseobacter exili]
MKQIALLFVLFITAHTYAENIDITDTSKNNPELFPFIGKVEGNRVNIRSGPNVNFEILTQLLNGGRVTVLEEKAGWYRITPPEGIKLWVHGDFVLEGKITAYSVNVRSGPGTNSSIVTQVEKGEPVNVLAIENGWVAISPPQGAYAWVSSGFVEYEMLLSEYSSQIAEKIEMDEKKKKINELLVNAEDKERLELYKPLDEADIGSVIKLYDHIIDSYPDTEGAITSKNRVAALTELKEKEKKDKALVEIEPDNTEVKMPEIIVISEIKEDQTKEPEPVDNKNNNNKILGNIKPDNLGLLTFEGKLKELGVVFHRPGSYKLVRNRKKVCILRAGNKNINKFLYMYVRVSGKRINSSNWRVPVLQVIEINEIK